MATALYSNPPLADFVLSEASGQRSRDNVHVRQSGAAVKSGTVLVRDTVGSVTFAMAEGSTGNPTISATSASALVSEGVYTVEFTSATAFVVKDPTGTQVGSAGALGTAFSAGGLGFTLTAGTTEAVVGDEATLLVVQDTVGSVTFAMAEGSTGNPTISATSASALASEGVYTVEFTSATAFKVKDPTGTQVGSAGTLGTAFSAGGLGFTLTAGTTAAVAGDEATLLVIPGDDNYVPYAGSGTAVAILYSHLPAATGLTTAVAFTGDCEVKRSALTGLTAAAEDDLKKVGIKVRGNVGALEIHTPAL